MSVTPSSPRLAPGQIAPTLAMPFAPWRLSGQVIGTLLNDPAALAALGDAVHLPPYKAPPRAPVLYVKPRNTLAASGSAVVVPADVGALEIGATLGLVIGRSACRLDTARALDCVAGFILVADLSVPHDSFYRPSVRFKARDGSCLLGQVAPRSAVGDPDGLVLELTVDGQPAMRLSTAGRLRPAARLLADISDFMTLHPGDIVLLGMAAGAPRQRAGQAFALAAPGLGRLAGRLIAETPVAAA